MLFLMEPENKSSSGWVNAEGKQQTQNSAVKVEAINSVA